MLPLLRVTLPGCVLIATLGLAAGFNFAPGPQPTLGRVEPPARGALIVQEHHPEWKQFLVLAAVRRAEELERLRDLHDHPAAAPIQPEPTPQIPTPLLPTQPEAAQPDTTRSAGLPATSADATPADDDVTGTVTERALNDVLPVDIGEASSTELPIGAPQTVPPPAQLQRIELHDKNSMKPDEKTTEEKSALAARPDAAEQPNTKRDIAPPAATANKTKPAAANPRRAKARITARAKQPAKPQNESAANPLAALFSIFEQTGTDSRQ